MLRVLLLRPATTNFRHQATTTRIAVPVLVPPPQLPQEHLWHPHQTSSSRAPINAVHSPPIHNSALNYTLDEPQITSLNGMVLVSDVEEKLSITLSMNDGTKMKLPSEIVDYVVKKLNEK
ncbi:hypothetical protein BGZ47_010122 [Haplosporangium gracile]|nr:hypothetical protein BGZ47_010122 [Haplosporangium gracile]